MLLQTLRRSTIEFTPNVQTLPTKQGCCGKSDMKVLFFLLWPLTQAIRVAVRVKRLRMTSTSHSHVHCATVKRVQRLRDHSVCWRATFLDVFWSRGIRKWPSKWQLNWCQFIKPWALGMSRTVSGSNCLQRTKLLVPLTLGVELPKWWIKDLLTQPHGSFFKKIEWHYAAVGMFGIGFLGWLTSKSPCWLSKVLRNDTYIHIKYDIDIQVMISNTQKHHIYSYIYYTYTCMRVVVQKVHFEAANSNEKNASQATFISSSVSWKWKTSASSASSKASPLPDPIHPGNVHSQASSCQLIK